jgi:hypothetical protein
VFDVVEDARSNGEYFCVVEQWLNNVPPNGGMAPREALWRYTGAIPVMAGNGATTRTRRQVDRRK